MTNKEIAEKIMSQIITKMETEQVAPWQKPWLSKEMGLPRNGVSNKVYRGMNLFILAILSDNPFWMTYKQVTEKGGHVKAGEKGVPVIYWNWIEKKTGETDQEGKEIVNKIPFLRYYVVFNATQCEGLPEKYYPKAETTEKTHDDITEAQAIIDAMPNRPQLLKGDNAYYTPALDTVTTPELNSFHKAEDYYSTMFHELAHSTGHKTRLNRKGVTEGNAFGSHQYGQEELVAEFTASFLCYKAGITERTIDTSTAYIQGWKNRIQADPLMVISAGAQAQKAMDYILNIKEEETTDE